MKSIVRYVILLVASLFALFPIYWMVSTSFKPLPEWTANPTVWITSNPTEINYAFLLSASYETFAGRTTEVVGRITFQTIKPFFDSLVLSGISTLIALTVGTLAAYTISRYKTGGDFTFFFILMFRMFPPIAIIIPVMIMYSALRLIDTYVGLIIAYSGFTIPFVVWLMKSFFDEIPREIDEAAMLDGCSLFSAFSKGVLPLARAGLAVTGLFIFILNWSDFMVAFLLAGGSIVTIPVHLLKMTTSQAQLYGPMAALGTIAVIPVLVLGLAIQKYLVRGLTFGAIKGR